MLIIVGEGFGDGVGGAKELHGGMVTDDGDIVLEAGIEELAVFEGEVGGVGKIGSSRENGDGVGATVADFEVRGGDGERGDAGDVVDFF